MCSRRNNIATARFMSMQRDSTPDRKPRFHRISHSTSTIVGSAIILVATIAATICWIAFGWFEQFPIRWFLVTNLSMTVAVFMLLLLLQHSRRLHMRAIHAKLDELIRSGEAGNHMIASERMAEELLEELRAKHREMASRGD